MEEKLSFGTREVTREFTLNGETLSVSRMSNGSFYVNVTVDTAADLIKTGQLLIEAGTYYEKQG